MMEDEQINVGILSERIKNLDVTVNRLEKRLFGNGTPGELARAEERIRSLEKIVWRVQAVGMLGMIAVDLVAKYLFK